MLHCDETGYYLSTYAGYADDIHRSIGSSGGIVTWLLEKLLEEKIIDFAICVTPNDDPEKLFTFSIINTPEKPRMGAGSVYYPVEMSDVIRFVLSTPGKYAIVGLPCFVKAIRLAQLKNKKLNERIIITIGLVCGQMKNKYFTDYIATLAGVNGKIMSVRYREKSPDQPASNFNFTFTDDNYEEKKIFWKDGVSNVWLNRWFTPKACNYCDDVFAECADIVCMDAWLMEYSHDSKGTSLVLVRSPLIANLINTGVGSHSISLNSIPIEKIIQSQRSVIENKRRFLAHRLYQDRRLKRKTLRKRVVPVKLKNPLLRREIALMERMQVLSRNLWNTADTSMEQFTEGLQPYLRQKKNCECISRNIALILRMIRKKTGGSRYN
ncbi:MAG: Coenzyme F420 hydrogenase/dehydrogenase, beta subunit C-terminal domain [Dehalobacter sp.]|nr:Coenzyme F420 hydrogenase/dehydrogenase, beta subunit C-terminal domain [Dehalobacter sp.]